MDNLLPTVEQYRIFLYSASEKFNLSLNECRDKFGKYTIKEWETLLN